LPWPVVTGSLLSFVKNARYFQVGGTEQQRLRLVLLGQDQELVMHERAVGARRAHRLDLGQLDGVLVVPVRPRLVVDIVEDDFDRSTARFGIVQRLEHDRPLEFIECAFSPKPSSLGARDECEDALHQAPGRASRQAPCPHVAGQSVLEAPGILLRRRRAAVKWMA
jgi:hypothetical protein